VGKNWFSVSTRDFDRLPPCAFQTFDRPPLAEIRVAHMLHGAAGIDRKTTKSPGKPRNKMQHGISALSGAGIEKHSMFQGI
jgi:hypothetical protein